MTTQNLVCNVDADDGHWRTGTLTNNLALTITGLNGSATSAFYRFQLSASIAQNSVITAASFEPVAVDNKSDTLTYTVKMDKVANSAQPSGHAEMSARTYTAGTAFVDIVNTSGARAAHSIASELQELVNLTSLASGDYITIVLISQASPTATRRYRANEQGSTTRANFDCSYDDPPAGGGTSKNLLTLGVG